MSWDRLKRTGDATLPITLDEAKAHLRVDHSDEDSYITDIVRAAADWIEGPHGAGYVMTSQEWKLRLDWFPSWILIPLEPVQSIDTIEYVDDDGATQTLAASEYETDVHSSPVRIRPVSGKSWPSTDDVWNAVTVTFTAGHVDPGSDPQANVPQDLRAAVKLIVGHLYENRSAVLTGTIATELPMAVQSIVERYRVGRFGC